MKAKYLISGLIFGFFNEYYFQPMWVYSELLGPKIPCTTIPLIAIPGWSIIAMCVLLLCDWLSNILTIKLSCTKYKLSKNKLTLIVDIILFMLIYAPLEYVCHKLGLWEYKFKLHESVPNMIIAYGIVGLIISSIARRKCG